MPVPTLPDVIERFIVDSRIPVDEFSRYWHHYTTIPPEQFAVIKVSGECIEKSLEDLGRDIGMLSQLGLYPVVVHGWGSALSERLKSAGIETKFDGDGDRITNEEVMEYVLEISEEFRTKLSHVIQSYGAKPRLLPYNSVFKTTPKNRKNSDTGPRNGFIESVNAGMIKQLTDAGIVPIVSPIGTDIDGVAYNNNADTAADALVIKLRPMKYIMLTEKEGIIDAGGNLLGRINLRREYQDLEQSGRLREGDLKKLIGSYGVLNELGAEHSIQVTSPRSLPIELFTRKGDGTYIELGYNLHVAKFHELSEKNLRNLIESGFAQRLVQNYFKTVRDAAFFVEADLKGVAVFDRSLQDIGPYLNMLAVQPESQGNGLGAALMREGMQTLGIDLLSWRSQPHRNNWWYFLESDGHQRIVSVDEIRYNAFWKGHDVVSAARAVGYMKNKPSNFVFTS